MNARYYVSSLARFLTSDTVVPDPTAPQSLNRYTYVYNNPIRLVDPSGHCAGYKSTDPDYDKDCWSYLSNHFCQDSGICQNWQEWISLAGDANWSLEELQAINSGLLATKAALESIGLNFHNELGGTKFVRMNVEGRAEYTGDDKIVMKNGFYSGGIFLDPNLDSFRVVLHELGHAIDSKHKGNGTFLSSLFPGQWGNEILRDGTNNSIWFPSDGYCYRSYGCGDYFRDPVRQQKETFADAFASFVYDYTFQNSPVLSNGTRLMYRHVSYSSRADYSAIYTWMTVALNEAMQTQIP